MLIDSSLGCLTFAVQSFYFTLDILRLILNLLKQYQPIIVSSYLCYTKGERVDFETFHILIEHFLNGKTR